jgi:hypothetical protein
MRKDAFGISVVTLIASAHSRIQCTGFRLAIAIIAGNAADFVD